MGDVSEVEQKLIDLLTERVHGAFIAARRAGVESILDDAEGIAAAMSAALPVLDPMDELIGPFYDTSGLVKWLGKTRQTLSEQTRNGRLIGMQDGAGKWVYPTWQFDAEGRVHTELAALWRKLRTEAPPWTAAAWMCAPSPDLDGVNAVAWIKAGRPIEPIEVAAAEDVERWSW